MEDERTSTRQAWWKFWAEGRRKGRGAGVVGEMTAGGRRGWSGGAGEINGGREGMVGVEGTGTAMGRVSAVAAPSRRLRGVALAIACRHFRALMGVSSRLTQNSLIGAHAPLPASHPIEIPPLSVLRHIAPAPLQRLEPPAPTLPASPASPALPPLPPSASCIPPSLRNAINPCHLPTIRLSLEILPAQPSPALSRPPRISRSCHDGGILPCAMLDIQTQPPAFRSIISYSTVTYRPSHRPARADRAPKGKLDP